MHVQDFATDSISEARTHEQLTEVLRAKRRFIVDRKHHSMPALIKKTKPKSPRRVKAKSARVTYPLSEPKGHLILRDAPVFTVAQKTVAEFFAGIGLVRMGLEKAGWHVTFANDMDGDKKAMYEAQFTDQPSHLHFGDIHRLNPADIPTIALATASFPCTDLSLAGSRHGLAGKHSSAFWGFVSIIERMEDRRPPMLLIENVLGFLSANKGQDFCDALNALNRLGYAVDPFVIDASWFVPQSRQRLFVVATLGPDSNSEVTTSRLRPPALMSFINQHPKIRWNLASLPNPPQRKTTLVDILDDLNDDAPEWWSQERAQYFMNQMSPKHRGIANRMIENRRYTYATAFRRVRETGSMAEIRVDGIAGCLRTPRGGSGRQILFKAGHGKFAVRLLTPRECARLMGADNFCITGTLNQALFGFGDAVCVPAISWIAETYLNPLANHIEWETK